MNIEKLLSEHLRDLPVATCPHYSQDDCVAALSDALRKLEEWMEGFLESSSCVCDVMPGELTCPRCTAVELMQ